MEKKQTAVQLIYEKMYMRRLSLHQFEELFKQAIQMEREQIEEAFQDGWMQGEHKTVSKSEYYEETFKP